LVAKLNADGEAQWLHVTPASVSSVYHEIVADRSGRVWAAGMFKGETTYGKEAFRSTGEKDYDGLIVHLDSEGKLQWAHHLSSPATDYGLGVCTVHQCMAYLTGAFSMTDTLDGTYWVIIGG